MSSRVRSHVRSNIIGYVALFVALSGSAWAAATVGSRDIRTNAVRARQLADASVGTGELVDGAITNQDLAPGVAFDGAAAGGDLTGAYPDPTVAPNAIGGADVADGSLTGADIGNGSLSGADVADGSLSGDDLADNSLTGTQVDESTLTGVNADKLDNLDSTAFPRQSTANALQPVLDTGLRWGSTLFRTQTDDVNFGGVHLMPTDPPFIHGVGGFGGHFIVCPNPQAGEFIPLVIEVDAGSGTAQTTRTVLTTDSVPASADPLCSGTIAVNPGDTFKVMARSTIIFGWEGTSFNQNPDGDTFRVIGFSQG